MLVTIWVPSSLGQLGAGNPIDAVMQFLATLQGVPHLGHWCLRYGPGVFFFLSPFCSWNSFSFIILISSCIFPTVSARLAYLQASPFVQLDTSCYWSFLQQCQTIPSQLTTSCNFNYTPKFYFNSFSQMNS